MLAVIVFLCACAFMSIVAAAISRGCFGHGELGLAFILLAFIALAAALHFVRAIRIYPNWPTAIASLAFGLTFALIVLVLSLAALNWGSTDCSPNGG